MTKYKVSELYGAALDAAVAKAEGLPYELPESGPCILATNGGQDAMHGLPWSPSTYELQSGLILERRQAEVVEYLCTKKPLLGGRRRSELQAWMVAYVHSRFGDEVELP